MPETKNPSSPDAAEPESPRPGTKGRPTPKRKEAEARRRRPLVPEDRKAAAREARARMRAQRDREFMAMKTGDEKNMPLRERGPVKRFIRDYVDARWNLGEFFLPVAIVMLFATAVAQNYPQMYLGVLAVLYGFILATIVQAVLTARSLRKALEERFGEEGLAKGNTMYGVMRSLQIRRSRLPRPMVKRGEHPDRPRPKAGSNRSE